MEGGGGAVRVLRKNKFFYSYALKLSKQRQTFSQKVFFVIHNSRFMNCILSCKQNVYYLRILTSFNLSV
jgi:hypothetical protein